MQALAPEHVVYAGSASKSLAPALRLGWLVLPAHLVDDVAAARELADGPGSRLDQLTLAEFIVSGGYDRHVRRARLAYRRRRDRLVAALRRQAPQVRRHRYRGRPARAVELPPARTAPPPPSRMWWPAPPRAAWPWTPLAPYRVTGRHDRPALIVGYGTPPEHAFSGAVARLCAVLRVAA